MDELEAILREHAETDEPLIEWNLSNNGVVNVVKVETKATADEPAKAFAAACELLNGLLATDYRLVNRAELGVKYDGFSSRPSWRGTLDVCLRRAGEFDNHVSIPFGD